MLYSPPRVQDVQRIPGLADFKFKINPFCHTIVCVYEHSNLDVSYYCFYLRSERQLSLNIPAYEEDPSLAILLKTWCISISYNIH